jgi:hypothetical protein
MKVILQDLKLDQLIFFNGKHLGDNQFKKNHNKKYFYFNFFSYLLFVKEEDDSILFLVDNFIIKELSLP